MTTKRKHKPNARGYIQIKVPYIEPITGLARVKTIYGITEEDAAAKKATFLAVVESGLRVVEAGMTLAQWAHKWLELYKKPTVVASTLTGYTCDINLITAVIGHVPLRSITQAHIMAVFASLQGKSQSTIRKTKSLLVSMLDAAVANQFIRSNPARGMKAPRGHYRGHRALDMEEIKAICTVVEQGHRYAPIVLLMLFCGLRRGEACAIHADDVLSNSISITKAVRWTKNRPALVKPKSKAGVRSVAIPNAIRQYLRFEGYAAGGDTLPTLQAFERGYASFMTAVGVLINGCSKRWQPKGHIWIEPNIRPHDLRHTYATLLYDAGVDVKTAQQWLGHASPSLTMSLYTHLTETRKETSATLLSDYVEEKVQVTNEVHPKVHHPKGVQSKNAQTTKKENRKIVSNFNGSVAFPPRFERGAFRLGALPNRFRLVPWGVA